MGDGCSKTSKPWRRGRDYVDETDIVVRLENMRMFDSSRFRDGGHLANQFHTTQTKRFDSKTGELKPVVKKEKLAKLWLEWPKRRQVERVVYEPGRPQFFDDCINRWQVWVLSRFQGMCSHGRSCSTNSCQIRRYVNGSSNGAPIHCSISVPS